MKNILLIACAAVLSLAACKKDTDEVSKVVKISFPTININGSKFMTINVGAPFTDEGATLIDDVTGAQSQIMADTTSAVDPTTPGLYTLTYSAKNANGYGSVAARYVAVTNYTDQINLSGRYQRQAAAPNNRLVNVTRLSRALYETDDFGGAGLGDAAYFAVLDTTMIDFGYQYSETIGSFFTADVSYLHVRPGDTSFAYALHAPGYGTAVRTFKKQ